MHSELEKTRYRIYIETSIVSYLVARQSRDVIIAGHQLATQVFWDMLTEFEVYLSDMVLQEVSKGDPEQAQLRLQALTGFPVLEIDDEARNIADQLIAGKAVPKNCPEDALHIAVAAVNGMDIMVTWNFKHINNPLTKAKMRQIIENQGYAFPEICSPDELTGDQT
ncbi:MAG: PIN domain-containing protein [Candidatus Competibacteraceae bacterium]|nr:MAG: PIN domain-containing protein [Candidatus Competibacteraceae bacterium]